MEATMNMPRNAESPRPTDAGPVALSLDDVQAASGGIWPLVAAFAAGVAVAEYLHHH